MLLNSTIKVFIIYVHVCMHLYILFPYSQTARAVPHLFFPLGSEQSHANSWSVPQTQQNPLGTPEHIATFVVNTLFNVILGATYGAAYGPDVSSTEPKKITVWFETYR